MNRHGREESLRSRLVLLSRNLWWTWHPEVRALFRDLDPELWTRSHYNPVEALRALSPDRWAEVVADPVFHARVDRAVRMLEYYLEREPTWGDTHAGPLRSRPVAYFCAEFGLHECLPTYSGGLGVLAGDHLKSASDLGVPLVAVGLYYREGYFRQVVDRDGRQQALYIHNDPARMPMDRILGADGQPLLVQVETSTGTLKAQIWSLAVGRCRLILLDAEVPGNGPEGSALSRRLYGGDQSLRLAQEVLLGIGGMRALAALGVEPGVLHMNEGHCAFAVLELARAYMQSSRCDFAEAFREAAARTVFTTHTPVPAGHDRFPQELLESQLGIFRERLGLSPEAFMDLGRIVPGRRDEPFSMTVLGLHASRSANAVSALNGRVTRRLWRELWPGRAEEEIPIGHVTNGVHAATWVAPEMHDLFDRAVGPDWPRRLTNPDAWQGIERVDDIDFWSVRQILKHRLIGFAQRKALEQSERWGVASEATGAALDPSALTIGFARRFTAYKRPALLLGRLERLARLVCDPGRPVQILFAGKAHPNDEGGQEAIRRIVEISRSPVFQGRIVFLEDYDLRVARYLVQGVDLWLNHPRRPQEASGTSGQKAALNGVLNLSVLDGWWPEAWDGANGFAVPAPAVPPAPEEQDALDLESILLALECEVVPLYYQGRGTDGIPRRWVERMRRSIRTLIWKFNSDRMVIDYVHSAYLKAAGALSRG